jgi:hypothetical protein
MDYTVEAKDCGPGYAGFKRRQNSKLNGALSDGEEIIYFCLSGRDVAVCGKDHVFKLVSSGNPSGKLIPGFIDFGGNHFHPQFYCRHTNTFTIKEISPE